MKWHRLPYGQYLLCSKRTNLFNFIRLVDAYDEMLIKFNVPVQLESLAEASSIFAVQVVSQAKLSRSMREDAP